MTFDLLLGMEAHGKLQNGHIPDAGVQRVRGVFAVFVLKVLKHLAYTVREAAKKVFYIFLEARPLREGPGH